MEQIRRSGLRRFLYLGGVKKKYMTGYIKKHMKKWLFLLVVVFLLAGCQKKLSLEEYLDLGDKYLTEANYREAIVAFTKAIEIEPKAMKSYVGLANAYIKIEDYKNAQETITRGISVYEGLSEAEQTEEYKQYYETLLKLKEEVEDYLSREGDSEDKNQAAGNPSQGDFSEYQEIIDDVASKMESGDREQIWQRQSEDDYQSLITKLDHVLKKDCGNGKWLLIYPCGHCYYGEMKNGKRSGQGIWCAYDYVEGEKSFASCTWSDDYPNGDGEEWSVCLPFPRDHFHTSFTLKDGLYHGTVQGECNSTRSGETFFENYSYECSDGIAAEVEDLHPREIQEDSDKERYCIYSDDEQSRYAVRGYKKGILHAKKGIDAVDSTKAYSEEEIQDSKQSVEEELKAWEEENLDEGAEDAQNEE